MLVEFVRPFEVQVHDEASSVGPRLESVVEGQVRTASDRHGFEIAADASINEHGLAINFTAIEAEEAVGRNALMQVYGLRLHSLQS